MGLNRKQQRFVTEYLKDSNATQAAIRAGYAVATARQQGSRLLTNADISAAVQSRVDKVGMSADEVLNNLADLARDAARDGDRIAALGMLGKYHKLFTERVEHDATRSFAELVLAAQRQSEEDDEKMEGEIATPEPGP